MSMPMSPPTSVPLIRMNWRSRAHLQLDPLGGLLAVPAVDGVADHLGQLRAVALHGVDGRVADARVDAIAQRAVGEQPLGEQG